MTGSFAEKLERSKEIVRAKAISYKNQGTVDSPGGEKVSDTFSAPFLIFNRN